MKEILLVISLMTLAQGIYGLSCVKCDSSFDESCHFLQAPNRATECAGGLPEGTEDRCFIQFTEMGITLRGCLSENPHMLEVCESGTGNCQFCSGDQCNIDQTRREVCAICDSSTDPNCATSPASSAQICPFVYYYEVGGCYLHKKTDGTIQRGCMVSATNDLIGICRDGEECKICRGPTCNTKLDFQECHVCDSAAGSGDLSCLSNPGNSPTAVCREYGDQCAQLVVPNGKTVRGCSQELDEDISTFCPSNNCELCTTNNCNNVIFPSDRISCYQCNDPEDCDKDMGSIGRQAEVCQNYNFDDQCYTVQDGETVYRGCMSDVSQEKTVCEMAGDSCAKCSESGCNFAAIVPPTEPPTTTTTTTEATTPAPLLRCHQCIGLINTGCSYYQQPLQSYNCNNNLPPGETQRCYTSVQGNVVHRGCTSDGFCNSNDCEFCDFHDCNDGSKATMSCIQCNSLQGNDEDGERCKNEPEDITSTPCPLDKYYRETDSGCYSVSYNQTDNSGELITSYVERGCIYNNALATRCYDDEDDSCVLCQGDGCNIHEVSFSPKLIPTTAILLLPFILVTKLIKQ
ncbi:uncharacterized protein LOC129799898 [Phlebotomus papatasi]|uniref:uncharacterized protein LOC129799898 n=1 Tax=Phlebotomus papatasi TaxID=29031 RepID=UPI002483460D|nr:uncharacterized protein LOC129799898 [Phlebotomus papatasi]